MTDLEVPVQAHHCHCDEAPAAKKEARPAVEPAALPAEQPAVGETRHNEKWLSCHWEYGCEERQMKTAEGTKWEGRRGGGKTIINLKGREQSGLLVGWEKKSKADLIICISQ